MKYKSDRAISLWCIFDYADINGILDIFVENFPKCNKITRKIADQFLINYFLKSKL